MENNIEQLTYTDHVTASLREPQITQLLKAAAMLVVRSSLVQHYHV